MFDYRGIFGFDISSWQDAPTIPGTVDFQKTRAYGARFVVFRASIGDTTDADYYTFMANCKNVLPVSAYHYYSPSVAAKTQAARFWNTIKADPPRMVWLDCEEGNTDTWRGWYDFIEEFKRLSGFTDDRIGIYTGYYIWTSITTYATNAQKAYFGKFPLWLAWYFADPFHPNYSVVRIPYPWDRIAIIQSGTPPIGKIVGVESEEVDYNHLNGGENELAALFGGTPPTDPPGDPMTYYGKMVYSNGLNLRNGPGTSYTDIGDLANGDLLEASEIVGGWWHLTKATRNGAPIMTTNGLPVEQRPDVWASGGNGAYIQQYMPAPTDEITVNVDITYKAADGTQYTGSAQNVVLRQG